MEEMNKTVIENINEEVMDSVADQLTFGQTCASYALVGLMGMGIVSTTYLAVKGTKALIKHVKSKKNDETIIEHEVINNDESEIQEIDEDSEE